MAVSSMTGFARAGGALDTLSWNWELKSVNGRGLDVRCRLPAGFDAVEQAIRKRINASLKRGSVSVALQLSSDGDKLRVRINHDVLDQLAGVANDLSRRLGLVGASVDGLLGMRGIIEIEEPEVEAEEQARRETAILTSFDEALSALMAGRDEEGLRLREVVEEQLAQLVELVDQANQTAAAQPDAIRTRFEQKLAALLAPDSGIAPERLDQELAVLITKADVREELDRLGAHIEAVRELLQQGGAIGRRLDFLAQELNREANTVCSKSQDLELTRVGIELKTLIDQFREQVQNIE